MQAEAALDPENRALYAEILRAPIGFELDAAVATTYSLDFETALVIPATMAFQAAESRNQVLDTPLALLEGLERLAGRIAIFCEAGRIKAVPEAGSRLTALLEDTVTEVLAPAGGAFHPKLWALRFRPLAGEAAPLLRLALLSRNLTTDRSWDLSLCLDGTPDTAVQPANAPLAGLLRRLPDLASGRATPAPVRAMVAAMAADVERAVWVPPPGVQGLSFAVNGLGDPVFRPRVGRNLGIISPFLSPAALDLLTRGLAPDAAQLLSRAEEIAPLPEETRARFCRILVMNEMAETEDGEDTGAGEVSATTATDPPALGLHAKAFITERWSTTEITLGSGNATAAALLSGANVEVFATLAGPTRLLGRMEDQLSPERLGRFLSDYQHQPAPEAAAGKAAEARLEAGRRALAGAELTLRCRPDADGLIALALSGRRAERLDGMRLQIWPLAVGTMHGADLAQGLPRDPLALARIPLRDVTRWLGIRLTDNETGAALTFSLGTTLRDLPDTRSAEILRSIIENRDAFLRYLRLLLGDAGAAGKAILAMGRGNGAGAMAGFGDDSPILEQMVRALNGDGRQLQDIGRLIDRLGDAKGSDDTPIIPDRFLALWEVFRPLVPKGKRRA